MEVTEWQWKKKIFYIARRKVMFVEITIFAISSFVQVDYDHSFFFHWHYVVFQVHLILCPYILQQKKFFEAVYSGVANLIGKKLYSYAWSTRAFSQALVHPSNSVHHACIMHVHLQEYTPCLTDFDAWFIHEINKVWQNRST